MTEEDNGSEGCHQISTLQGIPEEVRLKIYEKCQLTDDLSLRLVCSQFKHEIDQLVGIRKQVTLRRNYIKDPVILQFLKHASLHNVNINLGYFNLNKVTTIVLDYNFDFDSLIQQPLKIQILKFSGDCFFKCRREKIILRKCTNLKTLVLNCGSNSGTPKFDNSIPETLFNLPFLTSFIFSYDLYDLDLPVSLYEKNLKIPLQFLQSIAAPNLTNLKLEFDILFSRAGGVDILDLMEFSLLSLMTRSNSLKSVCISITGSYKFSPIPRNSQFVRNTRNYSDKIQSIKEQFQKLDKIESFIAELDASEGYEGLQEMTKYTKKLKHFGLKMRTQIRLDLWPITPVLESNSQTLKTLYLFCGFLPKPQQLDDGEQDSRNFLNFMAFAACPNIEVISIHDLQAKQYEIPVSDSSRIWISNLIETVVLLKKLKVLILNGFIISSNDCEDFSMNLETTNLEVLGILSTTLFNDFWDGPVSSPGRGNALPRIDDEPQMYRFYTGLTPAAFRNLMKNRKLNALLLGLFGCSCYDYEDIDRMMNSVNVKGDCKGNEIFHITPPDTNFVHWRTGYYNDSAVFPLIGAQKLSIWTKF